jgi:hypothetical protein
MLTTIVICFPQIVISYDEILELHRISRSLQWRMIQLFAVASMRTLRRYTLMMGAFITLLSIIYSSAL